MPDRVRHDEETGPASGMTMSQGGGAMRAVWSATFISLALWAPAQTFAQAFPSKAVRFVIPFPVGGSSDANARIIIPPLTERWKQQIIVEPRPGAGTVIGTEYVSK